MFLLLIFLSAVTYSQELTFDKWETITVKDSLSPSPEQVDVILCKGNLMEPFENPGRSIAKVVYFNSGYIIYLYEGYAGNAKFVDNISGLKGKISVKLIRGEVLSMPVVVSKEGGIHLYSDGTEIFETILNNQKTIKVSIDMSDFDPGLNKTFNFTINQLSQVY